MAQDSCQHRGPSYRDVGTRPQPARPARFARALAGLGTVAGPGPPAPAPGSAAVNPAAQPDANLREAAGQGLRYRWRK
jgi:hypothetical protein